MLQKGKISVLLLSLLLVLAMCTGLMTIQVSAEADPAEEPEVTMTTDRSEYSKNDKITETVKIDNTTDGQLTNVSIRAVIPDGYEADDGTASPQEWISGLDEVAAGDSAQVSVVFSRKDDTKPGDTTENNGNGSGQDDGKNHVSTGDTSKIFLSCILFFVSMALVILLIKKKMTRNTMTLILAVVIAGTMLYTNGRSVNAAALADAEDNLVEKTVGLTQDVVVDGESITLSVVVTYSMDTEGAEETMKDLSYDGYTVVWEDLFEGDSLNLDDWNIETHEPGWVNNELQEYTESPDNIYVKDGNLVIKPIKTVDESGNVSYTSGRVNTQNKHDFKYGLFEARVKVPAGQGYLPAFWMMPTNENLYGQWPRCGEIDIMEVLGHQTDTSYGTIHYGNPHSESQGSYTLKEGNFVDEYHTFTAEWEPGKISWYVDGILVHTENDWYSATEGQGEITYPAPFDQPFYMILNLAVGGNWPGNPDATTDFDNAALVVDYVRVYQKDSYDENVQKPEKEVILRDPDENGNYIINGDFAVAESLTDDEDWIFLTTLGGEASAEIKNKEMVIKTTNAGTADYSVQLVQPNLPLQKGGTYKVTFDAYADEDRTMIVDVSAPDRSYQRYLADTTVDLTTTKKTYTYEFTMTDKDDANGRLEFNLGNTSSTATVRISNVKLEKTGQIEIDDSKKTVLADGNYVYNGSFQEGADRMAYWDVTENGAEVSVTNTDNIRKLKIVAPAGTSADNPVIVSQSDLALSGGADYALSLKAEGASGQTVTVIAAGNTVSAEMTGEEQTYNYTFSTPEDLTNQDIVIKITEPGTYYLDDIRIVEDSLIKNGSFSAGFSGFEPFVDGSISSQVTYVVDSLSEENAADFTIKDTGDADWKIQLKQSNVCLEEGQWYTLKFDAKSDLERKIQYSIQRDGSKHTNASGGEDWTPYVQDTVTLTGEYQTIEKTFQMKEGTDTGSIFNIAMGAVGGTRITEQHRICIDNISLEKVDAPEIEEKPAGENLLTNGDFADGNEGWDIWAISAPGAADVSVADGAVTYAITNVGEEDWNVQLKQGGLTLEQGSKYRLTFKASSSESRTIKLAMLSASYAWYGGADIALTKDQEKEVVVEFTMNEETDPETTMVVSMGKIAGEDTPASTITLRDFSLVKVEETAETPQQPAGENLLANGDFSNGTEGWNIWAITSPGAATASVADGTVTYDITDVGTEDWNVQLKQENLTLEKGSTYCLTFKASSTAVRTIKLAMLSASYAWYGGADITLTEEEQEFTIKFTMNEETDPATTMVVSMGKIADVDTPASAITLRDFSLVKLAE